MGAPKIGGSTALAAWPGLVCAAALTALSACRTTVDSLGYDIVPSDRKLHPLTGPGSYPNAFRDVLGKSDAEIDDKITATFNQLFHGDPDTQAIYFPSSTDQAYIEDILHGDIRTEGIGYGMMICVELDKREEFDRLWAYAKGMLQYKDGPNQGYFLSYCGQVPGTPEPCIDPFGFEQFAMALVFAHDRWGEADGGTTSYEADALALFDTMLHKEDMNGGVVDGVTNSFDSITKLAFDVPNTSAPDFTRPSIEMPAYYELWAQATGDPFWHGAALSARAYWKAAANPNTGLWPARAYFNGKPVPGSDVPNTEGYRAQLNLALDQVWFGTEPWEVDEANRLLQFFYSKGIDQYCRSYTLDGTTCLDPTRDDSLVAVNGVTGLVATTSSRTAFISAVWDMATPSGSNRYYSGVLDLLGLMILGGRYRVY